MGLDESRRHVARRTAIEILEDRVVLTAGPWAAALGDSVDYQTFDEQTIVQHGGLDMQPPTLIHHAERDADFWIDWSFERDIDQLLGDVEQTLASAHGVTGLTQVRNDYGFIGTGQTVAIIDSGIAYDHYALGGGLGANYRVVGGWDFAENDSNPYDDGPWGSHGTHVAGIVGADRPGTKDDGVAPGVDLVGLRVFNDAGDGYFHWVEDALKWVIANHDTFVNPITAVNLSLGTAWNSTTLPSWAMLEDEFAELKDMGIFISVSAGNAFTTYNEPGLSYPAASPHVVPVMSVDDNGSLSYFSQRHTSAIAAPGRFITSTVPDYAGNNNGITDDFASFSGTSMAAPYVAGASVLVRQAMEFVGYTNITQDVIYQHMIATADRFFDTATGLYYNRLNLAGAFDALMPEDDFGSSVIDAYNLGTISSTSSISGLIGTLDDADYFTFTAGVTGTISFTADVTHDLAPVWDAVGGTGWVDGQQGETYTFEVVAGQSYSIGLLTSQGIGYYGLTIDAEAAFTFTDWGVVTQSLSSGLSNSGETWYRVEASQAGYLSAEALFAAAGGDVWLALYDTDMQLVAGCVDTSAGRCIDAVATSGEEFFLRVTGTNEDVNFRLTNLVSIDGSTVTIAGTSGADTFSFTAGMDYHTIAVNGVSYQFDAATITTIRFEGGAGYDTITLRGTAADETATLRPGEVTFAGAAFTATATSVEHVTIQGGGGNDFARFYDSAGNDVYASWGATRAVLYGDGFFNDVRGFTHTIAHTMAGGNDRAVFYDTAGDDVYAAWGATRAVLYGDGHFNDVRGFKHTIAHSTSGGNDRAVFYDTPGDDVYAAWGSTRAVLYGDGHFNDVRGFKHTIAYSTLGGNDRAVLYDTPGDDVYISWGSTRAVLYGDGYFNDTRGYRHTTAFATRGGNDRAVFYDTPGDDVYIAWGASRAVMYGDGHFNDTRGFRKTTAFATAGGNDRAVLYGTEANNSLVARAWGAYLQGPGFYNDARGFDHIAAQLVEGSNTTVDEEAVDYLFEVFGN